MTSPLRRDALLQLEVETDLVRAVEDAARRRDPHTPGSAFTIGAERYAAEVSRWKRVA
jgi:hypothetical protein